MGTVRAMSFTEWTVLPHQPVEKLAPNLWSVSGTMPKGNQRRMTLARLSDGRVIVHNAIALDDDEMKEIDAFGNVAAIVVPNGFHRQDAGIWKARYPEAKVYAPRAAMKTVSKVAPVNGDYEAIPRDAGVRAEHLDGMKGKEGVLLVQTDGGTTAVFNDTVLNMPKSGGLMGLFLAPTGRPGVPRFQRMVMIKNKAELAGHFDRVASNGLVRIIVGHGDNIEKDAAGVLSGLAKELRGSASER